MRIDCKRISWGSIIAGLFTVIAVSILLSLLGTSIGLAMIDPKSSDPTHGVSMAFILWSVLSFMISLFLGGYVAGRLAASTGAIHGFLVWATTLVVYSIFTAVLGIGIIKMAGSAVSMAGSTAKELVSGSASAVGQTIAGAGDAFKNTFSKIDIDTDINNIDMKNDVKTALKETGIETLQPDYLQKQLDQSAKDLQSAIKSIAMDPTDTDEVLANLHKQLKTRLDSITGDIDKQSVVDALQKNSDMNKQEAEKVVDNYLAARDKIKQTVQDRLDDAQQALQKAQAKYEQLKEQAKEKAAQIASETAKLTLWTFFAFILGAILSAVAGCIGARHTQREVNYPQ
ncbi:hypothetical protein RHO15_03385 [Utexia brackfieldae]|uniref:CAP-Gly protein n=1 Tax=Utexia brackfieldae TaxID=3074108 RepID=UPI00370D17E1